MILMLVSFYTSRVVLNALGVEDFGVYNVVGGIVAFMAVFNSSMSLASNRFMSFALGKQDNELLNKTYIMSTNLHILLSFLVVILAETIGLWYFYTYLNIPQHIYGQAFVVYQLSVGACVLNIISIPNSSLIMAYEDMGIYAYISIVEGILKLSAAYILTFVKNERLSFYAIFIFIVSVITISLWWLYAKQKYHNVRYHLKWHKDILKDLTGFIGWQFIGSLSWLLRNQGVSLVLNFFFGPILNAARAIGNQVNSGISSLVGGFQSAVNPQLVKNYAGNRINEMHLLIFRSSKLSFLLLFIIAFPVLLATEPILKFWLKIIPDYGVVFVQLMIIASLVDAMSGTLQHAALASGKIKQYTSVVTTILITDILFVYIGFKLGFPPQSLIIVEICLYFICLFGRLLILRKLISLKIIDFIIKVTIPEILVVISSLILIFPILYLVKLPTIFLLLLAFIIGLIASFFIGFNSMEKEWLVNILKSKLVNKHKIC